METITKPPELPTASVRKRPRAKWWVLLAVALFLALVSAAGGYIARYQPLTIGSAWAVDGRFARDLGSLTAPSGEDFSAYKITYKPGGSFWYAFDISNEGKWGVTITGVNRFEQTFHGLFRQTRVEVIKDDPHEPFDYVHTTPFQPFSLGPEQERGVVVRGRFANCDIYEFRSSTTLGQAEITFRVLGITKHALVTLPYSLEFVSPPDSGCPARATSP